MKILFVDIETSPHTAYIWKIWQENIGLSQLIDTSSTLCWSAKWYGSDEVMFSSIMDTSPRKMIKKIHKLMDEADVVVHYYGSRFDLPVLNREFLIYGMEPPAPYKSLDLLTTIRREFKFVSNKLGYVCEKLGLGKKHETNFKLWVDCMNKDPAAWDVMKKYNIQDVLILEKLYERIRPWIKRHPNIGLHRKNSLCCTTCGSNSYTKRGFYYSPSCVYQRYQCRDCGKWFRGTTNIGPKLKEKYVGV